FSSRRRHTRFSRDWSSDVCSSDLGTNKHNPNKGPLTAYELKTKLEALHTKLVAQLDKMQKTDGLHLLADDYNGLKSKLDVLKPRSEERRVGKEGRYRGVSSKSEKK